MMWLPTITIPIYACIFSRIRYMYEGGKNWRTTPQASYKQCVLALLNFIKLYALYATQLGNVQC